MILKEGFVGGVEAIVHLLYWGIRLSAYPPLTPAAHCGVWLAHRRGPVSPVPSWSSASPASSPFHEGRVVSVGLPTPLGVSPCGEAVLGAWADLPQPCGRNPRPPLPHPRFSLPPN